MSKPTYTPDAGYGFPCVACGEQITHSKKHPRRVPNVERHAADQCWKPKKALDETEGTDAAS